ncbi:MAG: GGDEF domain-containing protein, partial [Clostridiales bacterium]|nr:GGDEF domain-containing protein [Clostridiales bacterium]
EENVFCSEDLIPGYDPEGKNHLYAFVPLHESDLAFGYLVFRDCIDKVENRFLHVYSNRMSVVIDKFRHTLALDLVNKRLIDLMRRDPLTNVNNRIAFDDKEKFLQAQINSGEDVHFAVAMFDVNSLKLINDTYGHESGDVYLVRACRLICNVFKHSPVYRMGGDEFVAILTGEDYDNRESLVELFNESLSPYTEEVPLPPDYISVAIGVSDFDPATDLTIADVNKRADEAMYKDKGLKKDIL